MSKKNDPIDHGDRWWKEQKRDYEARQLAFVDETDEERDAREAKETNEDLWKENR